MPKETIFERKARWLEANARREAERVEAARLAAESSDPDPVAPSGPVIVMKKRRRFIQ